MKKTLLLSLFLFLLGTIDMLSQNTTTLTCGMPFTDNGGANENYSNNSNVTYIICPSNQNEYLTVSFSSFNLESNYDFLRVYINGTLVNTYTGLSIPAAIVTTQPGQCLQFQFTSDQTVTSLGWTATITCGTTPPPNTVTCFPPTSIGVTGTATAPNGINATITLNNTGNGTAWEIIAQLASLPAPTATSAGTAFTTNPFTVTGLINNNVYRFYVRTNCGNANYSVWIPSNTLTLGTPGTTTCAPPNNISATGSYNTANNTGTITGTISNTNQPFQYVLIPQGASAPSATTAGINGTTSTFSIPNLQAGTYTVYVRNNCGNGLYSIWIASNSVTIAAPSPPPVCGGMFYDNGDIIANYSNNSDTTTTICPTNPGDAVTVTFLTFNTESNWDALYVFNGNSIAAPQFASTNGPGTVPGGMAGGFWGNSIPGPFTSTASNGCLTFRFRSDGSVSRAGWEANVTCAPAPTCPAPNGATASNIGYATATIAWTSNSTATQWEVITQLATAPAPTAASVGTVVSVNPLVITNLTASTTYRTFIRNVCNTTDSSAWTSVTYTTLGCANPVQAYVTQVTQTTASVLGTNSQTTGSVVEVLVLPSGTAAPTTATAGTVATPNGYVATNLTCGTAYIVYIRVICDNGGIVNSWVAAATFTTLQCVLSTGQPNNLFQCSSNGVGCFTLTENDLPILGGLSPANYTVAYYLSTTNAANQTNPLSSPFCTDPGTFTIIARLTNLTTGQAQYFTFTVTTASTNPVVALTPLSACDDNSDGQVVFNLTNLVNTSNPLAYYTSATNATAQINAITNPSAHSVAVTNTTVSIFIRETSTTGCDNLYSLVLNVNSNCNVSSTCINAFSLCGALGVPFNNTHNGSIAESGNNYGCLTTRPNPSWFYLPVSVAGAINLTVEQNTSINFNGQSLDVDYIVYGPFTNPVTPCATPFTQSQIVSCSYSSSPIEYPVISNAVAGQYYLIMTTNFSNQAGFIKISLNATSQGAIDCTGIRMNAFLDANSNGTQDSNEANFPLGQFHYTVNNGVMHNVTSPAGSYTVYENNPLNNYDLSYSINPSYASQYAIATSSYTNVNVSGNAGLSTYNFPITVVQSYTDVAVYIVPLSAPRAGFTYKNKVVYTNLGNQTIASGVISFNKDAATTITANTQSGTLPTATGFNFTYSNLLPFETRSMTVTMNVPSIPVVSIAQLLTNMASISPTANDIVVNNNLSTSTQGIIAAYDPNDKVEAHGEKIVFSTFPSNEYLYYTIRFENLGNASAINITVNDVLDLKIDETTVEMVNASHNYTLDRIGRGLSWKFDNIQLPVSVANTDIGKGYITFRTRLKPGFAVGDIIPNTAAIYFDTNPAIITNTFNTEFVTTLGNTLFDSAAFSVYPNPASQSVQILLNSSAAEISKITLYDVVGKTIKIIALDGVNTATIDVSSLPKGMYLLSLETTAKTKSVKKLIIQ